MMTKKIIPYLKQNWILLAISLVYIIWALAFIVHSSYIATDGRRYFNLFDDAMISMRYAWNFAHGYGLVWNTGEYVEGYTNLLMTLLMSAAAFLFEKRYAPLAIQIIGIFFSLGTAFFALKIFETLKVFKTFRFLPFILVLLYYPLNFWSLMGMETGLLSFLLGAGVYASLCYVEKLETKYLWGMAIFFGLAHLTRNESLLFAALAFVYLISTLKHGKKYVQWFFLAGALYSLFVIGQIAFRYFYYGELVPNTYTLKLVGMAFDDRIKNGWGFIKPYLTQTGFIIVSAFAGILWKPSKWKNYLFGFFLVSVLYQIYVGGDSWNYWRIMAPTMPFLLVTFILSLLEFFEGAKFENAALLSLSLIGIVIADARFMREFLLLDLAYQNNYARAHVETAIALNELTDEDATIGVFWAGTLPYYLDRQSIDFLGKSDKYIANLLPDMTGQSAGFGMTSIPGHNKHDLTYSIQKLLPTYAEEFDYGVEKLSGWAQERYVRVKYGEAKLYLLKDSPHVKWEKIKDYLQW
jgi:hypothetical protein